MQNSWISAKERLHKIHAIATVLHSTTSWNEYMIHHGNEYPELGKKRNFTIGIDTRWSTHLEECKQLVQFQDPIINYQRIKWESTHKKIKYQPDPNINILLSDFKMISKILPIFDTIYNSFKSLESRETYLSKFAITICFIQDEIYY